jgi:hypothetical protein
VDAAWIGAISALGGVAVGSLAEWLRARAAFDRDKAWTVYEERRGRIEQIYELLEGMRKHYADAFTNGALAIGDLENTGAEVFAPTRHFTAPSEEDIARWAKLRMVVHLYAPSYVQHLSDLDTAAARTSFAVQKAEMHHALSRPDLQLRSELQTQYSELNRILDTMLNDLVAESRQITAESTARLPKLSR